MNVLTDEMVACDSSFGRYIHCYNGCRMSAWDSYPDHYRSKEVCSILSAVEGGECVSLVGLSGAGKSNLLGFLANRKTQHSPLILVDCNRLHAIGAPALFQLVRNTLGSTAPATDEYHELEKMIHKKLAESGALCLMLDRFDALDESADPTIAGNLRALRDASKYQLTYVIATRHALDAHNELAELFFGNTIWLGPLSEPDALWNCQRYAQRKGLHWDEPTLQQLVAATRGYPSFLRAACEACASGIHPDPASLLTHPAVQRVLSEFWDDQPTPAELQLSGLADHPLLQQKSMKDFDTSGLTAKETLLLEYFQEHVGEICSKDDLIHAVWPEDRIFQNGIRDDSLAQLVRRLRRKIEPDPAEPSHIHNVPGRGYRFETKP